jgi:hypothetical protein
MRHVFSATIPAILVLSYDAFGGTIVTSAAFNSCDSACQNPVTFAQTKTDGSPVSFSNQHGSVYAEAAYGVWKASAESTFVSDGAAGFTSLSSGSGVASAVDSLTFNGGNGSSRGTLRLHIDGEFGVDLSGGGGSSSTSAGMSFYFLLGAAQIVAAIAMDTTHGISNPFDATTGAPIGTYDPATGYLTAEFEFEYGLLYNNVGGFLSAIGDHGGFSRFGNTVTLEFLLPEGTTIQSESGASYRIQSASEVPEPTMAGLFLLGCLAIAGDAARCRNQARDARGRSL